MSYLQKNKVSIKILRVIKDEKSTSKQVGGVWHVLHISLLVIKRLIQPKPAIFFSLMYSLHPKDLTIQNLFVTTWHRIFGIGYNLA